MKQVVNVIPTENIVLVNAVTTNKYYGVQFLSNPDKGFLTRTNWHDGLFTIRDLNHVTEGNGWDAWDSENLSDIVETLLSITPAAKVYEFETWRDLAKWLMEKI